MLVESGGGVRLADSGGVGLADSEEMEVGCIYFLTVLGIF